MFRLSTIERKKRGKCYLPHFGRITDENPISEIDSERQSDEREIFFKLPFGIVSQQLEQDLSLGFE
jgi:hypothetical protein